MKANSQLDYRSVAVLRALEEIRRELGHGSILSAEGFWNVTMTDRDCPDLDPSSETRDAGHSESEEWRLACLRYGRHLDLENDRDLEAGGVGCSGPAVSQIEGRTLLVHKTCTHNTVICASEHRITGWSWTRDSLARVPLQFGPPPSWLVEHMGWSQPYEDQVAAGRITCCQLCGRVGEETCDSLCRELLLVREHGVPLIEERLKLLWTLHGDGRYDRRRNLFSDSSKSTNGNPPQRWLRGYDVTNLEEFIEADCRRRDERSGENEAQRHNAEYWRGTAPVSDLLRSLEATGRCRFTEANDHGEGYYGEVVLENGVPRFARTVVPAGYDGMDYGVSMVGAIIMAILKGEAPPPTHLNSNVRAS